MGTFSQLYLLPEGALFDVEELFSVSFGVGQSDTIALLLGLPCESIELHVQLEEVVSSRGVDHHAALSFRSEGDADGERQGQETEEKTGAEH